MIIQSLKKDNSLCYPKVWNLQKACKKQIRLEKIKASKPEEKLTIYTSYRSSLKINQISLVQNYHWQNQWNNLHLQYKSLKVREILHSLFSKGQHTINNFYLHKYHGGLRLVGNTFGFYNPKLVKALKFYLRRRKILKKAKIFCTNLVKNPKNKVILLPKKLRQNLVLNRHQETQRRRLDALFNSAKKRKDKDNLKKVLTRRQRKNFKELKNFVLTGQANNKLNNLARAILVYMSTSSLHFSFTHYYLPKNYVLDNAPITFGRFKIIPNYWEGLQLIRLTVENKAISQLLAKFVYISIRRNPKRTAFMIHIKRIINWHFAYTENLMIQGIRIEVKGRFNAKSRSKKYILSVGRVAKQEKTSKVDYAFITAITIFGSLAIKVWVCPFLKQNVITTAQNKVSKSA